VIADLLYLGRADLVRLGIAMRDVIVAMEAAILSQADGAVVMPGKATLAWKPGGRLNGNAAAIAEPAALGIKWNAEVPANVPRGLPNLTALVLMNDPETGFPTAVIDGTWVTAMRTGAVSAITARHLAPRQVETLALIGCGVQMRTQAIGLATVLRPRTVRLFDLVPAAMEAFSAQMKPRLGWEFEQAPTAEAAVRDADLVVSATKFVTPPEPTLKGEWLKPGALAMPIDVASVWEPLAYLKADKFVTDRWDILQMVAAGGHFPVGLPPLYAELHEIVSGRKAGRETDSETIMVMNEGMPIEDIALGRLAIERAAAAGIGVRLPFIAEASEVYAF
jgi:ornithine cyclodeaminase/alanine dehydrogenase-like protein (mu-crystallin family)